jgi:hypothetical protein
MSYAGVVDIRLIIPDPSFVPTEINYIQYSDSTLVLM